uniref:Putative terminase n=1 Tax=viral metagenome TaxID=1070528 RepID=A0A6M3JWD9_9ZZZZ
MSPPLTQIDINALADLIIQAAGPEEALKAVQGSTDYTRYQADPVGFGEHVLGETYTDDVKRMMESVRDNVITVAKSGNATGKTHGAARVGVWWFKAFPGSQVYTAAAPPESNLRKLLWGEIGSIVARKPLLFDNETVKILHVERGPQSFLTGVTIPMSGTVQQREAKFSGKHAPFLLFILDEGDAIPPEVYQGIESCMSGGHARLLVMFNPRAEMGPVNRMEREGRANVVSLSAFNHPNVTSGKDRIPGL